MGCQSTHFGIYVRRPLGKHPKPTSVASTASSNGVCGSAPSTAIRRELSMRKGYRHKYRISSTSRIVVTKGAINGTIHQGKARSFGGFFAAALCVAFCAAFCVTCPSAS